VLQKKALRDVCFIYGRQLWIPYHLRWPSCKCMHFSISHLFCGFELPLPSCCFHNVLVVVFPVGKNQYFKTYLVVVYTQ
jgi:hypothetical protein